MRTGRHSDSESAGLLRVVRPATAICGPFDRLRDAAAQLVDSGGSVALVTADDGSGRPIGWLTPRDVVRATARDPAALADLRVRSAMTACGRCCPEDASLPDVLARMREGGAGRLAVVSSHGRLRGIVSLGDLAALARLEAPEAAASLRHGICEVLAEHSRGRSRGRAEEVGDVMTPDPVVCRAGDPLGRAAQRLYALDVPCLPVLRSDGRLAGIVSARGLCRALLCESAERSELAAAMGEKLATCWPDDSLEAAEAIMRAYRVRRLPVVGSHGDLMGLLSLSDVARAVMEDTEGIAQRGTLDELVETLVVLSGP